MPTALKLKQDLAITTALELITESLGEVAAIQYKGTHERIAHNAFFFQEIARVYHDIKLVAAKRNIAGKQKAQSPKTNQTVSVLLTSNYQFYGNLDKQLSLYFIANTAKYPTDLAVVGSTGKNYLEGIGFGKKYEAFSFHTDIPTQVEINQLLDKIKPYSRILIYHSRFTTILDQEATITELSSAESETEARVKEIDFILEPELEKMLEFFETQILASRLDSIFLQAQLSRTTARMVGMDEAQLNAGKEIDNEKSELTREKKRLQNLRILETYTMVKEVG